MKFFNVLIKSFIYYFVFKVFYYFGFYNIKIMKIK